MMSNQRIRPAIVENFPLTVGKVAHDFRLLPPNCPKLFFHYTTMAGFEGILNSGGLWATYRMRMNDSSEFTYARDIIYESLDAVMRQHDLRQYVRRLACYTRLNLDKFLKDSIEYSRAYCACLSLEPDSPKQWETYAHNGEGFALGFDLLKLEERQCKSISAGNPFVVFGPVIYDNVRQRDLVPLLIEAGIADLKRFGDSISKESAHLTACRDKVSLEIGTQLFCLIDYLKCSIYSSEREIRLILDTNNGTMKVNSIQYFERNGDNIPYIFIPLRCTNTRRLPLDEIIIGYNRPFLETKTYVEGLLDKLGYVVGLDWPIISRSEKSTTES